MEKGSYTLFLGLKEDQEINVGALGKKKFSEGFYAYNGSALGKSGFSRIKRHKKLIKNGKTTHWHIDYLLTNSKVNFVGLIKSTAEIECELSQKPTNINRIDDFGCSDCKCGSHLLHSTDLKRLKREVLSVHKNHSEDVESEFEEK